MKWPLFFALAVGAVTGTWAVPPQCERAFRRFWLANTGKTVARVPVNVVPENAFISFGNYTLDLPTCEKDLERVRRIAAKGSYNCFTVTLRSRADLNDAIVRERVAALAREAHAHGIQVLMDIDARIGRFEFLKRWPDDAAGVLRVETFAPTNGLARFEVGFKSYRDHMAWGARAGYDPMASELAGVYAVRVGADGLAVPGSRREVESVEGLVALPASVSGAVRGLADDETLVVAAKFRLLAVDPCSPHLTPYLEELARAYGTLGADGAMRDEWGFPPMRDWADSNHRAMPCTDLFAAEYAKETDGRDYVRDCMLAIQGERGRETERRRAVDAMMRVIWREVSRTESEFYAMNRRVFGEDVYVTKHPTWHTGFRGSEFMHNGLDWWTARRDFAQSDETVPLPCILGMARKTGGHVWLNEGYGPDPDHYGYALWRYALCGGRMVYHGIYGSVSTLTGLPPDEAFFRCQTDILTPGNVAAQTRVRLLDLITRAQVEVPVAMVFGHFRTMNWLDAAYLDGGLALAHRLGGDGWYAESFPSTELELGTFRVDEDGFLRVGSQRYAAAVLHRLSEDDVRAFERVTRGRTFKTRVFSWDSPATAGVQALAASDDVSGIEATLVASGAVRQTPLGRTGLRRNSPDDPDRLPDPDGVLTLNDGTVVRVKASLSALQGEPVRGTLKVRGVEVEYAARGLFAVRLAADGRLEALAAGGLESVKMPGFELKLDHPEDVALLRLDGVLRGVWQTNDRTAAVPEALQAVTPDWIRLWSPRP